MKILVAMSGGVDSSVAAKLLRDSGNECVGCTMRLYDNCDAGIPKTHTCCSLSDVEDARSVAFSLGMRYYVFNFTDDFREKVIKKFAACYLNGQTPNPCIDCNRYMKFDKLFERADILNCDLIATGHYARIEHENGKYLLKKALDEAKDQSYVLYSMTQEQLSRTLFPLGALTKPQVRSIAASAGFVSAEKPDSQDICFVPDGNYAALIRRQTGKDIPYGNFIDKGGNIIGCHKGITAYTIGQHRGLGLSLPERRYVCSINAKDNTVTLGGEADIYRSALTAGDFNWISGETPSTQLRCRVKIRYRQPEQPATLTPLPGGRVSIVFDEPQRAITPGQAAVAYDGDLVLGGGVIYSNNVIPALRLVHKVCERYA